MYLLFSHISSIPQTRGHRVNVDPAELQQTENESSPDNRVTKKKYTKNHRRGKQRHKTQNRNSKPRQRKTKDNAKDACAKATQSIRVGRLSRQVKSRSSLACAARESLLPPSHILIRMPKSLTSSTTLCGHCLSGQPLPLVPLSSSLVIMTFSRHLSPMGNPFPPN